MGIANNLLQRLVNSPITGLRCSLYSRTVALLGPSWPGRVGRSLRFLEMPLCDIL